MLRKDGLPKEKKKKKDPYQCEKEGTANKKGVAGEWGSSRWRELSVAEESRGSCGTPTPPAQKGAVSPGYLGQPFMKKRFVKGG